MEISTLAAGLEQPKKRKGLVIINTGNGKGKTTSALGLLLRAWGHDMRVVMLQFIKNTKANFGEHRAARRLGLEIIAGGDGFVRPGAAVDIEKSQHMAAALWERAKQKMLSGEYDMVILDELSYPLQFGWVPVDEVIATLSTRPANLHVVITGRGVPKELIEYADLVTESMEIKHPHKAGIRAQAGIEF